MIRIYGASDDLIEIEGDISEEFSYADYHDNDQGDLLGFSDGTILRITYDNDGIWRIQTLVSGRARLVHIVQLLDDPDDGYSDTVYLYDEGLDEPIRWVLHGGQYALPRR